MSFPGCNTTNLSFEQGPIRPPNEARSLLIRVTRNCPWNKCGFCRTYRGQRFSIRTVEEVKQDITTIKTIHDEIKTTSWRLGFRGDINQPALEYFFRSPQGYSSSFMNVALWLYYGEGSVFLQDGNNLAMKTNDLIEILNFLTKTFPEITRVTTYARAKTIATRRSGDELKALHQAGLSRIHIGLESGCNEVLELVKKGVTADEHILAGQKVKKSGLSLSEYVIPGLGGRKLWQKHAVETARVLNAINPDYIRLRTLRVVDGAGLDEKVASGEFVPSSDEEIVEEIRLMIEHLDGIQSYVVSDHILNLLEEVGGKLPEQKAAILAVIDRFLQLSQSEKNNFRLGRRAGVYRGLDDMENPVLYHQIDEALQRILNSNDDGLEEVIAELARQYI